MEYDDDTNDIMDDFMSLGSPKRKYVAPKPTVNVQCKKIKVEEVIGYKREDKGIDYASRHRVKEEKKLASLSLNMPSCSGQSTIDSDSDKEDEKVKEDPDLPELEVFQRYQFALNPQELPILKKREKILDAINRNMVIVLTASTGTGKSSQVPQYILEEARKKNENCNIIVTQPRRIAGKKFDVSFISQLP
jgi:HrpA-like RNA helicase